MRPPATVWWRGVLGVTSSRRGQALTVRWLEGWQDGVRMRGSAFAWITLAFFGLSIIGHWLFGRLAFADEVREHGTSASIMPYPDIMGRDTLKNRQSKFQELLWQGGSACFLDVASQASRADGDRTEARLYALIQRVGREGTEAILREIDHMHERRGGHARIPIDPPVRSGR